MKIQIPEEKRILYIIGTLVIFVTVALFIFLPSKKKQDIQQPVTAKAAPVIDEYGINIDSLVKMEKQIEKNETKSKLLADLGVPVNVANVIIEKTKNVITPKDYRVGLTFYTYTNKKNELQRLIFQFGVYRYVSIGLKDSITVFEKKEEVKTVKRTIAADISGSLYATLDSLKLASDPLADKLANVIFPSKIDFTKLQIGDSFKIIFDDIQVKGKSVDVGDIHAVLFVHKKENYYAFHYVQGSINDYYDEKATTLREGYLKSPLKFARISSRFSLSRLHPVLGVKRPHLGTDYAAPTGTPILSIGNGVVIEKGYNGGFGNMVKVKHNASYTTQYAHMSKFAAGIKKGSVVKKSQVIGYVGSTGLASGPHVDFRFWKNGKLVDHTKEKYPISNPIDKKYKSSFLALKDKLMKEMDSVNSTEKAKP
jgi:murein DD-endopeptidase MepM/ murein hydrolase activator NlpD